jgi:hypothetical protein
MNHAHALDLVLLVPGKKASLADCQDASFSRLGEILRRWFPMAPA